MISLWLKPEPNFNKKRFFLNDIIEKKLHETKCGCDKCRCLNGNGYHFQNVLKHTKWIIKKKRKKE